MRQVDGEEFLEVVARDMERNPQQYKEYVEEISQVAPDYPSHKSYMVVDHRSMDTMGGDKPCFIYLDDAVSWAEYNLGHNDYNIYQIRVTT